MNVGIVLLCRPRRFLGARVALDEARLRALDPSCDPADVWPHLEAIERIATGDPAGGPIAALSQAERYHWLVAPSSTIIQPAEAHTGLTADPAATLEHLFATLVLAPQPSDHRKGSNDMTWERAEEAAKPVLKCPLCGGTQFDQQQGRMDSRWGITSHKLVLQICKQLRARPPVLGGTRHLRLRLIAG